MCNAWNHPPGCICGWGGEGHLGGGGGGNYGGGNFHYPLSVHLRRGIVETYVNPNATCPICGAAVYFYQSEYGGRVFFDELGPPWPKHPCTNTYNSKLKFSSFKSPQPRWSRNGLQPVLLVNIGRKSKHLIAFAIIDGKQNPII